MSKVVGDKIEPNTSSPNVKLTGDIGPDLPDMLRKDVANFASPMGIRNLNKDT